jgi:hypothetical protein
VRTPDGRAGALQLGQEVAQHAADESPYLVKRLKDVPTVAERYGEGRLDLAFNLRLRSRVDSLDSGDFYAVFERDPGVGLLDADDLAVADGADFEADARQRDDGDVECSVLVEVREPLEDGQRVSRWIVPSLVRLVRPEHLAVLRAEQREHLQAVEVVESQGDGEVDELGLLVGGVAPQVQPGEFPNHVVEGGAEVVDDLADDNAPFQRRFFDRFDPEHVVACLRVAVVSDATRLSLREGADFFFESVGTRTCPGGLLSRTVQRVSHGREATPVRD